jgi:hypothetical protein
MPDTDPPVPMRARQTIRELLHHRRSGARTTAYLVSYPRSGNTLVREYLAILQGRPQFSLYDGDVVGTSEAGLTPDLDHVEIIKSHQIPSLDGPLIYLVRDGRNASLSFLYMAFLFGGHQFSSLSEVYAGLRHLDESEGSWGSHVAKALALSKTRSLLLARYEDLVRRPELILSRIAAFLGASLSSEVVGQCIRRQRATSTYASNPYSGYTYVPEKNSIYDILKRHRQEDYWRHIFDSRTKRYFHEGGGTAALLHFGYERSRDWWRE